jgi:Tfp pilus assembly protein PilE
MTNEEFYAFAKKNPVTVVCAVITVLAVVGIYFRSGDFPEAEADLAQKSAAAERYALNIKYSAQLKEQLDAAVAANKQIEGRLTRASQQGINTQYFYKLQRETGVKLVSFAQAPTAPAKATKSAYIPVAFNVSVQGSFPQILDFLRQLESGTHYVRVLTANCASNITARSSPLTLTLTLEMLGLP